MTGFTVAFVCSGNRFRSPLAEHLLRLRLDGRDVQIESLGTLELGSLPPLPEAQDEGRRRGLDLSDHRSRSLAGADLSGIDLVIGFERSHIVTAVIDAAAARDRTFTLPELVGLLDGLAAPDTAAPADRARALVRRAAARRPPDPQLLHVPELPDPLRRTPEEQRQIAADIEALVERLASSLFGAAR